MSANSLWSITNQALTKYSIGDINMTMTWGIVARSRSTGIQIRKPLAEPYTDPGSAQAAADAWTLELNTEQKFGLNDWLARYDAASGGPTENNINPAMAQHPAHAQPDQPAQVNHAAYRSEQPGAQGYTGMNGRL